MIRRRPAPPRWRPAASALALALGALAGCGGGDSHAAGAAPRPDVLVLCIDGVGPDLFDPRVGAAAPALSGLAAEAVVYPDTLAPSPWAGDVLHALLSGLGPDTDAPRRAATAGDEPRRSAAPAERPASFVEVLRADGYHTVLVAAEDEHLRGYAGEGSPAGARVPGFDEVHLPGAEGRSADAAQVAGAALERLVPADAPVLLVCTFGDPRPPHRLVPRYAGEDAGDPALRAASALDHGELLRRAPSFSAADIEVLRRIHATEVAAVDAAVERVTRAAEARRGVPPVIVIAGLRRPAFGEGGRFGLVPSLEPEALRVPLAVRYPASRGEAVQPRGVAGVRATHADVGPTILDALGHVPRRDVDGRTLFPGASLPERTLRAASARGVHGTLAVQGPRATLELHDSKGSHAVTYELVAPAGGPARWVPRAGEEEPR